MVEAKSSESRSLLIVEDNSNYLVQLKDLISKRHQRPLQIKATYVSTLDDALKEIQLENYDGVLSDLFFPHRTGGKEGMYGVDVVKSAFSRELPALIITNTFHHEEKTQPACNWARDRNFNLVDNRSYDVAMKNFLGGILALGFIIECKRLDYVRIDPKKGYVPGDNTDRKRWEEHPGGLIHNVINFMSGRIGESGKVMTLKEVLQEGYESSPLFETVVREYGAGIMPE